MLNDVLTLKDAFHLPAECPLGTDYFLVEYNELPQIKDQIDSGEFNVVPYADNRISRDAAEQMIENDLHIYKWFGTDYVFVIDMPSDDQYDQSIYNLIPDYFCYCEQCE